jgi:hypothetical protein
VRIFVVVMVVVLDVVHVVVVQLLDHCCCFGCCLDDSSFYQLSVQQEHPFVQIILIVRAEIAGMEKAVSYRNAADSVECWW